MSNPKIMFGKKKNTEEQPADSELAMNELTATINERLSKGETSQEIIQSLVAEGWEQKVAKDYVNEIISVFPTWRESMKKLNLKRMGTGALFTALGVGITAFTYSAASEEGGSYYVTYGFVIYGVYDLIRGLIGWMKYRNEIEVR